MISLQGHTSSINNLYEKVKSLQIKLNSWNSNLNMKKTFMFQFLLLALRNETASPLNDSLCTGIEDHLLNLREDL
jgi:hypothetical protein